MSSSATFSVRLAVILLLLVALGAGVFHKANTTADHSHSAESCQLCVAFAKILPFLGESLILIFAVLEIRRHLRVFEPETVFLRLKQFLFHSVLDPPIAT